MDRGTLATLSQLMRWVQLGAAAHRQTIVVCHSGPMAWALPRPEFQTSECPPSGLWRPYSIGRTMFETDRLPPSFVRRCNAMDEVWVPTQWSKVGLSICSSA